jgi:hypothetical protein
MQLLDFVKDASRLGKNRSEINEALRAASWPEEQLNTFWSQYHDVPFPVPVPKPTLHASPRLTTLNLFFFIVLYGAIYSAISIVFTLLDYHLPDGLGRMQGAHYSNKPIGDSLRSYLAGLFACAPLVYFSSQKLYKIMAATGQYIHVIRLKLMNLTLLIAALIMLGDFIGFIYYLLSGELGIRFILKVLILTTTSAGLYYYFKPEIAAFEKKA